jgi:hypothetical protein
MLSTQKTLVWTAFQEAEVDCPIEKAGNKPASSALLLQGLTYKLFAQRNPYP